MYVVPPKVVGNESPDGYVSPQSVAVALTVVCYVLVHWGEGISAEELSITQVHMVLMMFYVYQVLYKFVSGIAKIATLFLLLAISTSTMRKFHLFCK